MDKNSFGVRYPRSGSDADSPMTPGELVEVTADALRLPKVTVGAYYRLLREAGLITKGGRGRSAAELTPSDVATLLIAIMASETAVGSPERTRRFGDFQLLSQNTGQSACLQAAAKDSFIDAFISLIIHTHKNGNDSQKIDLTISPSEEFATILSTNGYLLFCDRSIEKIDYIDRLFDGQIIYKRMGLRVLKSITESVIAKISADLNLGNLPN